jgi:CheY-like chemotaxis protein
MSRISSQTAMPGPESRARNGATSVDRAAAALQLLLVEDEPAIAQMYRLELEQAGYAVAIAADGIVALELTQRIRPDVIVLDLRLPRLDGLGVLTRLKASGETAAIPVVIVSNDSEPRVVAEASRLGASEYLLKSRTSPTALAERVAHWARAASIARKAWRDRYA